MSMYTRCSSCNTHFKVTVQQLQACSGQVRCGRCATVFDAFATLTARAPGKNDDPPPLENSGREDWDTPMPAPVPSSLRPRPAPAPSLPMHQESALAMASVAQSMALPSPMAPTTDGESKPEPLTLPENLFSNGPFHALPGPAWVWSAGIAALVMLALVQLMILFRAELAASYPGSRSMLSTICKPFFCEVPLPHYPDSLYIESSDLQLVDTARPQEVLLTASIRNRADKLQAYPVLELTLTNTLDHPLAKKLFYPKEYLSGALSEEQGFAPGAEIGVRLMLNTSEVRAAGYRLYLYFPN